jgi:hypothetical protein
MFAYTGLHVPLACASNARVAVIDKTDDQSNAEHKHVWSNFSLV